MLNRVSLAEHPQLVIPRGQLSVTPAELATRRNPEHKFYYDMFDLLTGKAAGSFFHHVVSGESISIWEDFTKAAEADGTYYQFNNEANLIVGNPDWFKKMIGLKDDETSLAAELGTGSDHSVKHKTMPWVKAVNGSVYVGIDESFASAFGAVLGVKEQNPGIAGFHRSGVDFNKDDLRITWNELQAESEKGVTMNGMRITGNKLPKKAPEHRTMAMFGGTLGNAEGFAENGLPYKYVVNCLKNYRRHMQEGDILFMGLDQNQNKRTISAAYSDERIAQFSMALLKRIKDELPVSKNFDPDDFEYANQWYPQSNLFAHGFRAKKDVQFTIRNLDTGKDVLVTYKKDQFFAVYCNSYKFPQNFVDDVLSESDFRLRDTIADDQKWMHIHALQAA